MGLLYEYWQEYEVYVKPSCDAVIIENKIN